MLTSIQEAHARLLARLPHVSDLETVDDGHEITSSIDLNFGGSLWFTVFEDGRLQVDIENVATIQDFEGVGLLEDSRLLHRLTEGMTAMSKLPPNDEWDSTADYGYADANVMGTETWEDQKQLESIKVMKQIPSHWYLTKCRNFDGRKLQEMQEWLKTNCTGEYKRVGWSSGCSTTVGIAFQSTNDAFFYRLRWR